jgi:uncharacterized membrane protein YhaH (DUF805 family)
VIFASIRHNLANLLRFSGRESRALFWPYALAVIALDVVAMFVLIVPAIGDILARMQRFAVVHPDQATIDSGPGHYSITIDGYHPELMPDVSFLSAGVAVLALASIVLLAAAVTRRLHDCRRPGWWGLIPLPFLALATLMMPRFFAGFDAGHLPDMRLFMAMFFNNLLYLGAVALLTILLAGDGSNGPNRFGTPAP